MARIGQLQRGGVDDLRGFIDFLDKRRTVKLLPMPDDLRGGEGAPSHEIYAARDDGTALIIGEVWSKKIKSGAQEGREMFSITVDHPDFPTVSCAAFPVQGSDKDFVIRTDRPRQQAGNGQQN